MRISVCEFLRLTTQRNWFYMSPGNWGADKMEYRCERVNDDTYALYRGNRMVKALTYFEGKPSHQVRKANIKKRRTS